LDSNGVINPLYEGLLVRPSGCRGGDCVQPYSGGELLMDQMVINYQLLSGLTWADNSPLTAGDSVFSFRIATDSSTPGDKSLIRNTASYQALDDSNIEWRGLPGYHESNYLAHFWAPLPEHQLGNISAEALLGHDASHRRPLGYGPYSVQSWTDGESITLTRNPYYFRTNPDNEPLPYFETLTIRFTGAGPQSNLQALANQECDILLPDTGLDEDFARVDELVENGQAQIHFSPESAWWHLDFGIQPLTYDDGHNIFNERPDFFSLPEIRAAIAQCVDRETLLEQFAFGQGSLPNSYVSPSHFLNNLDVSAFEFNPVAASATLESAGWIIGEDGVRVAQGNEQVLVGKRLSLRLHTSTDETSIAIAQSLRNSLDDCGIEIEIISLSPQDLFAPGPDGPLFGRDFDLALFAWPQSDSPACYLYQTEAIPGADPNIFLYSWGGWNLSGWSKPEFDAACYSGLSSLPGESAYAEGHALSQAIFADELPALPLFVPQKLALTRADFCNFDLASGDPLAAIESFGFAVWCQ
jgi:peptide/nickel transport system substrate-binding protein